MEPALTPIRRQYLDVKRRYPHAIVFFRLGDFYETFDDDAELCARELDLTLTSKPMGKGLRVPLAGIPYHAVDGYIAKLISRGYKVAICEQMSDPATTKGLVERRVVRVVTPGTVVEDNLLDARANNYLACLAPSRRKAADDPWRGEAGFAYVDISTGEFVAGALSPEDAASELARIRPSEVLLPEGIETPPWLDAAASVTRVEPLWFDAELAQVTLQEHFRVASPEAFGITPGSPAVAACAAVLLYLRENQAASVGLITAIRAHRPSEYVGLDPHTMRNLELFTAGRDLRREGSLLATLDLTCTAMGARLLRRRLGQPLCDVSAIDRRLDAVAFCHESALRRTRLRSTLGRIPDLERLVARVVAGHAQPRELVALRRGLENVAALREETATIKQQTSERTTDSRQRTTEGDDSSILHPPSSIVAPDDARIADIAARLRPCDDVVAAIQQAIADEPGATVEAGDVVRAGFSEELDSLRLISRDVRRFLTEMEAGERERTGIRSLKVGYNRVFGYYIEVSKANVAAVPEHYERRQSLVNAERFVTAQLREYESQILTAKDRALELETAIVRQVCAQVAAAAAQVLATAQAVAELDVACALAEAASRYGYVRPQIHEGDTIEVCDGRHPMVERSLAAGAFVPNDLALSSDDAQIIVLTGPNMAGKSTYLRQAALIVLMAQCGSFVPASSARIGVVDRIFTRVGAGDDLTSGQSTFMVEMIETSAILHNATPRSLIVLDEIGRGTSTYDGMAIARGRRVPAQPAGRAREDAVRHALPRADGAGAAPAARAELQRRGGGGGRAHRLPASHRARRRRPLVRRARRRAGGPAEGRRAARAGAAARAGDGPRRHHPPDIPPPRAHRPAARPLRLDTARRWPAEGPGSARSRCDGPARGITGAVRAAGARARGRGMMQGRGWRMD